MPADVSRNCGESYVSGTTMQRLETILDEARRSWSCPNGTGYTAQSRMALELRDVIAPDGRILLKSEWGPISDDWPAVSFSKRSVGERLRAEFNPDRDVLLYVGTTNDQLTRNPAHRGCFLCAVKVEPNVIHDTRSLVPPESWVRAQQDYGGRWEMSVAVRSAWDIPSLPQARNVAPESYRSLGWRSNWGNTAEAHPEERGALLALQLVPVTLKLQPAGKAFDAQRSFLNLDEATKREIARMVSGIRERVAKSGTTATRVNPVRMADSDLHLLLWAKVQEQDFRCGLCGGPLAPAHSNRLLAWSADRVDSLLPSYDRDNLHVTHLGCNLAKNDVNMQDFREWIGILRGPALTE